MHLDLTMLVTSSRGGSVADAIADYGFTELPIAVVHAEAVRGLPPHHRDPFDRLLVAQARVEGLTLVSRDPALRPYGVPIEWTWVRSEHACPS